MDELKPCPFCGQEMLFYDCEIIHPVKEVSGTVKCVLDGFSTYNLNKWNTRFYQPDPRLKKAVEEIEESDRKYEISGRYAIEILYRYIPELKED